MSGAPYAARVELSLFCAVLLAMDDQPPKKLKVVDTRSEPVPPEPALAQINLKAIDGAVVDARELPLTSATAELKAFVAERTGELATREYAMASFDLITHTYSLHGWISNVLGHSNLDASKAYSSIRFAPHLWHNSTDMLHLLNSCNLLFF